MSGTYTDVFGGATIYPSEISYSAVALSASITLSWPEEASTSDNLATRIMDVTPSGSYNITLPDASKTGTGNTILFTNKGALTFTVINSAGAQVVSIAAGTAWQVYLSDNSTAAGVWKALQFGATVSSANASSLAGTGIVAVGTLLSQSVPITSFSSNYTTGVADRAKMLNWTGTGSGTLTIPLPATTGASWFIYVRNSGGGSLVATPTSSLIDGGPSLSFQPGESAIVACDGSNYYTIGYGKSAVFVFDYTSISIPSGYSSYTLLASEQNRIAYKFTGASMACSVIVPNTTQQYWVNNATEYAITIKTASGTGITVGAGVQVILYCDGSNKMVNASSAGIATPISISNGGTGAQTASDALISLGGGATGRALFGAATSAAAWSVLGAAQSGAVNGGTF